MISTEPRFILFFGLVFLVHWWLRANRQRKVWLLAASYAFYAAWDWRFLSLILLSTFVDYVVGLQVSNAGNPTARGRWLLVSLATNLGLLGFFKYCNFFIASAADLLTFLGLGVEHRHLSIILPVGISFYTFQTLSYTIDIYRRELQPTRDLLDLALFVAFFPQLVAGPIVRARAFLPQLTTRRDFFEHVPVRASLALFLVGFVKKACISDNIAPLVDLYFKAPEAFDAASAWLGVSLYAVQIYCDFSGYSDMAIGGAGLLGYRLGENFRWPYFAANIAAFWRRWHISLSNWLRDYLYIPLGGNRHGRFKTYRNLLLTMLLGGLWHGAAWNFVVWGGLHGGALALHRLWQRRASPRAPWSAPPWMAVLGTLATFYFVCVAWIFFRSESMDIALQITRAFVFLQTNGTHALGNHVWLLMAGLAAAHWIAYRGWLRPTIDKLSPWQFAVLYGSLAALAWAFVPVQAQPFIYFQF